LRHDAFIGRWVYFHKGHLALIEKVYQTNHRPVLVMIMDTEEKPTADERLVTIHCALNRSLIPHKIIVIPPIASVNWGRNVGYETNHIFLEDEIEKISATEMRELKDSGEEWRGDLA